MNYKDFLIEVKTPWTKNEGVYERRIIQYNCIPGSCIDKPIFACRYLNEFKSYIERSTNIDSNEMVIHAINSNTNEELTKQSELIKCLLNYTKYQWNYEE